MFYVIYNPDCDLYMNDEGGLGSFADAETFECAYDAEYVLDTTTTGLRIVGPCRRGVAP